MPQGRVSLRISGRQEAARLPAQLTPAQRSTGQAEDPFLPADYLQATGLYDVTPAARGTGPALQSHESGANELIALEMADGSTLYTTAASLQASLWVASPELLGDEGQVLLDQLCAGGGRRQRGLGDAVGGLVRKVYTFALRAAPDAILDTAAGLLKRKGLDAIELGVSWLGTQALMAAIESQLKGTPGLHRWTGAQGKASDLEPAGTISGTEPILVFVHGTASSTQGSFGELRAGDPGLWAALQAQFQDRIYAFEHRTLSESPIENAIALLQALPEGAQLNLVSHSRGGLVADLLCLRDFDDLIEHYAYAFEGTGDANPAEATRVKAELAQAHAAQRAQLQQLATLLRQRKIQVQRYVRAASPASGTQLASANFDLFLSGLLTLIGAIPGLFGSPLYAAFKRVVLEIVKNRTNPHLVPGIEAMLPDSPLARLLRDAPVQAGITMSALAGDIQGGPLLQRLGVMLTDYVLFEREDNDLVVNTTAMLAGVAPRCQARVLFDRGADVSHFRYFSNADTRHALRDWLLSPQPQTLPQFQALPAPGQYAAAMAAATAASRDASAADRPVVLVLPGIMGTHLRAGTRRVWLAPLQLAQGKLTEVAWNRPAVESEVLFDMFYGQACAHLAQSHRVETFPYDWRQPLDVLAERLGEHIDRLLKETQQPVRLLAHSMGGLVVRACIHKRRGVMDALMAREGARLVMLGTPNQGAHSMVANLIGKGDTLRTLVRLDLKHDMQEVLDIVAGFPGALQLLPKPGFDDAFQGQPDGGERFDYQQAATWTALKAQATDLWFGDQRAGTPDQSTLDAASWLWRADQQAGGSALPTEYASKSIYVYGVAPNTPCGLRREPHRFSGQTRLRLVGTTRGDGTVTWQSGHIGGIGQYYYLPAAHGDLLSTPEAFGALTDLLSLGHTQQLDTAPPAVRALAPDIPKPYDAPPPNTDDPDTQLRQLLGSSTRTRLAPRSQHKLSVAVHAMDLRFVTQPIMVGHYEQDPIAGAEALIDRELLGGDLGERYRLGLYASRRGEATVVLRQPNTLEAARGSLTGAVVTGLGSYERALNPAGLTEAVRVGALRYLLQVVDVLGAQPRELPLSTLLLGYNSSANLTVASSVEALVRGVLEANERFGQTTGLNIRITQLNIVELYLDTAISATYALRELSGALAQQAQQQKTQLVCNGELQRGEGLRARLYDRSSASYWPRLIITRSTACDEVASAATPAPSTPSTPSAPQASPIADQLHYIFVGQRARAETVAMQRQPGLVEALVAEQIHNPQWNEGFGRTLFQLMIPYDFKDAARQLARVVLVVDAHTANLPWELMLADDPSRPGDDRRPLALRTAVVRQLSASSFRTVLRQGSGRCALVIGNPSVEGFSQAFTPAGAAPWQQPDPLPGAQDEAEAAQAILSAARFDVCPLIGDYWRASEIFPKLYEQPWRVLHISAHGVFDLRHVDGRARSGVLLSGGLLITAAEIAAMESVPELVFLNCCHLGQMDVGPTDLDKRDLGKSANKLAASVARELIEVGVRCVIVAGWAVNDQSAKAFAVSFYEHLLLQRMAFGDAVFEARQAAWRQQPTDITWGAFQAYGDPAWRVDPQAGDHGGPSAGKAFVCIEELLDELKQRRTQLSRCDAGRTTTQDKQQITALQDLLKQRCPALWLATPQLQSALAAVWYDMGEFALARQAFLAAAQAQDFTGLVPLRDIEQLANAEMRLAEQLPQGADTPPETIEQARALIHSALARLHGLDGLVAKQHLPGQDPAINHTERAALIGSAWKRLASLDAQALIQAAPAQIPAHAAALSEHLSRSQAAYRRAEGTPDSASFKPYHALNRLALQALSASPPGDAGHPADIDLARQCAATVQASFAANPNAWDAILQAEAALVEQLLTSQLGQSDRPGSQALQSLITHYDDALRQVRITPAQLDSILSQLGLLARCYQALARVDHSAARQRTAERLVALAQHLQPSPAAPGEPSATAPASSTTKKPGAKATAPAVKTAGSRLHLSEHLPPAPLPRGHRPSKQPPRSARGVTPGPINSNRFEDLRDEYQAYFERCVPRPEYRGTIDYYLSRLRKFQPVYQEVGLGLGIPWHFIGIIHAMEGGFNFKAHLHNGDPLSQRTVQVPRNRPVAGTPPFTWPESARDALVDKKYDQEKDWSVPRMLWLFEKYNGFGYRPRGLPSPYLWSFSNLYSSGKFTADGKFDPKAVSKQCGTAVMLKALLGGPA